MHDLEAIRLGAQVIVWLGIAANLAVIVGVVFGLGQLGRIARHTRKAADDLAAMRGDPNRRQDNRPARPASSRPIAK